MFNIANKHLHYLISAYLRALCLTMLDPHFILSRSFWFLRHVTLSPDTRFLNKMLLVCVLLLASLFTCVYLLILLLQIERSLP